MGKIYNIVDYITDKDGIRDKTFGKGSQGESAALGVLDFLYHIANILGQGSNLEGIINSVKNGAIPRSDQIESAIVDSLSQARAISSAKISKLQNYVNSFNFAKSPLQKEVIENALMKAKNDLIKEQARQGLAEDLANSALSQANFMNYAGSGTKIKVARSALERAAAAKKVMDGDDNTTDLQAVEEKIK